MEVKSHQISFEEYLKEQQNEREHDPCEFCKRSWCYGCEHLEE